VLTLLLILGLVVLVALAVRKSDSERMSRGCCSSGPWPPTDLIPDETQRVGREA
jgi:hypothetical protein